MKEKLELCFGDLKEGVQVKVAKFLGKSLISADHVIGEVVKDDESALFLMTGDLRASKQVDSLMRLDNDFMMFCSKCLAKHVSCDWGEIDEIEIEANRSALIPGLEGRVLSRYTVPSDIIDKSILIITEADRSNTTIMFSDEC